MTQKGHQGHLGHQNAVNPLMNDSKSNLPQKASEGALRALFTETGVKSPILEPHPLDHANVTKIMLGQSASEALAALGSHCLVIATKADSTTPEAAQGRIILHCLPCSKELLDAAYQVTSGSHRAARIKQSLTHRSHDIRI